MAEDPQNFGRVQLCLNDSRVVIGAVAKGRSSSFRLNGILRSMVPFLTLAQIALGLLWVETDSNAADYPSRFKLLPPPRSVPRWLGQLGVPNVRLPGFEVFAGSARITKAFIEAGWAMLDPVDILWGSDVFATWVTTVIASGRIGWLWLAPPCSSFSALRNLDPGGPLRPKGKPEGNESNEEVKLGNALWRRALELANLAYNNGIPFFIEHPRNSKAWLMKDTWKHLLNKPGVKSWLVDWCAFDDDRKGELPNLKATRIVGTGGWMDAVVKRCPGNHQHGKPLRGSRAKLAGAYPIGFCRELARSYSVWYGEAPQCRAVSVLPSESNWSRHWPPETNGQAWSFSLKNNSPSIDWWLGWTSGGRSSCRRWKIILGDIGCFRHTKRIKNFRIFVAWNLAMHSRMEVTAASSFKNSDHNLCFGRVGPAGHSQWLERGWVAAKTNVGMCFSSLVRFCRFISSSRDFTIESWRPFIFISWWWLGARSWSGGSYP